MDWENVIGEGNSIRTYVGFRKSAQPNLPVTMKIVHKKTKCLKFQALGKVSAP
jgi:hypothetical protein